MNYTINDSIFQIIDTEEKAYWLGFLAADGAVNKNGIISLQLKESDYSHVVKFRDFIGSNHPITKHNNTLNEKIFISYRLSFGSKKIRTDLQKYNIINNKSFTFSPPLELIPLNLRRHFWRGIFDADGCISSSPDCKNKNSIKWQLMIVGNLSVISEYEKFLKSHIFTKSTFGKSLNCPSGKIYFYSLGGMSLVQDFLNVLYGDSIISLERKRLLFEKCVNQKIYRKNRTSLTKEQILHIFNSNKGSWRATANELKTSTGRLYLIRKRLGMISSEIPVSE
jgi:hypothetical protein